MSATRQQAIIKLLDAWADHCPEMPTQDILFALYDDRMITGAELDYLMDKRKRLY